MDVPMPDALNELIEATDFVIGKDRKLNDGFFLPGLSDLGFHVFEGRWACHLTVANPIPSLFVERLLI